MREWDKRRSYFFLALWLLPLLAWLAVRWVPGWYTAVLGPELAAHTPPVAGLTALIAALWTCLIAGLWVAIGDNSAAHQLNFAEHKSIWVSFLVITAAVYSINHISFAGTAEKVRGLRATSTLLERTVLDTNGEPTSLRYWVDRGRATADALDRELAKAQSIDDPAGFWAAVDVGVIEQLVADLDDAGFQIVAFADRAERLVNTLVVEELKLNAVGDAGASSPTVRASGTSYLAFKDVTAELVDSSADLFDATGRLDDALADARPGRTPGREDSVRELKRSAQALRNAFFQVQAVTESAETAVTAGRLNVSLYLLVAVLYTAFLLFPWVLLFLFLLRKQRYLVEQKARLLERMGLAEAMMRDLPGEAQPATRADRLARNIQTAAFRNIEYVVSLVLLTVITATLWYFFFYPQVTTGGLTALISRGEPVTGFANYLIEDATPITFGFIGAAFFTIQMLLRRYFSADLNPKAYTYAVVRVLTVFILSVALHLVAEATTVVPVGWAAAIAFTAGIFPSTALRWILRWVNQAVQRWNAPEDTDRDPLTRLDGLNAWHEARLLEEKVENIQNLATAALEDLTIHTNFAPNQLIDWVDQALLYLHTREQWTDAFRAVGIRTATDLLDNTCTPAGEFDTDQAHSLVTAVNAAQAVMLPDAERPREAARLAAAGLYQRAIELEAAAQAAANLAAPLDAGQPATLDRIIATQQGLQALIEATATLNGTTAPAAVAAAQAVAAAVGNSAAPLPDVEAALAEANRVTETLASNLDAAREAASRLERARPDTHVGLAETVERFEAAYATLTNAVTQFARAQRVATGLPGEGQPGAAEWAALTQQIAICHQAATALQTPALSLRNLTSSLERGRPETFDAVEFLRQQLVGVARLAALAEAQVAPLRRAVDGLPTTPQVIASAQTSLDAAAAAVKRLAEAANTARDQIAPIKIDAPPTLAGLALAQEAARRLVAAAHEAQDRVEAAAEAVQLASAPAQMTREILQAMIKTIRRGPNIDPVKRFWDTAGELRPA